MVAEPLKTTCVGKPEKGEGQFQRVAIFWVDEAWLPNMIWASAMGEPSNAVDAMMSRDLLS
jgi:hypothetical protein